MLFRVADEKNPGIDIFGRTKNLAKIACPDQPCFIEQDKTSPRPLEKPLVGQGGGDRLRLLKRLGDPLVPDGSPPIVASRDNRWCLG